MKAQEKIWVAGTPRLRPRPTFVKHCPGCGHPMVERIVGELIEEMELENKVVTISSAGCSSTFCVRVAETDGFLVPHGRSADVATAMKAVYPENLVYTVQGDGDCIAIGAEGTINAAARAEPITIIMVNNAGYGTTGGQMAPTTMIGQVTSTTPEGRTPKMGFPVHVAEMLATMKGVVYSARGSVHSPVHLQRAKKYVATAFQRQMAGLGFSFVEILSMCPPDWHLNPVDSLKFVEEKMMAEYPLGVFKDVQEPETHARS